MKGLTYNFKFWQELGWGILVAILMTIAQATIQFDATVITDWQVWAISIVSGCVRAVAAIVVAKLTGKLIFSA